MTQLVQIPEQFKKEFKVDRNGEIIASIRGTARLVDTEASSLTRSLKSSVAQNPRQLAVFLISVGFDGVAQNSWIDDGIPGVAISAILEYYA